MRMAIPIGKQENGSTNLYPSNMYKHVGFEGCLQRFENPGQSQHGSGAVVESSTGCGVLDGSEKSSSEQIT